jgi:hypothetical protein
MRNSRSLIPRFVRVMVAALLLSPSAIAHAQAKALTLGEVLELRQQGVSSRQILRSAREYCIAFQLDDSIRHQLTIAGADTLLVGGLNDVCTQSSASPPPIVQDEFGKSTTSQGFTWSDSRCKSTFENDGVRLENTASDAMCLVRYPSTDIPADVRVELEVTQLGSTKHGTLILGFGRQDRSNSYYSLSLSADHRLELCWNTDRQCNSLVKVADVGDLRGDAKSANRLAVEVRGKDIALLVNDARVARYTADTPVSGRLMIGVGPQTNLLLVRLRATRLP